MAGNRPGERPDLRLITGGVTDPSTREVPEWYRDAKLGIFVHWTPASVPAFAPKPDRSVFELAKEHGWTHAFAHSPYSEWYQNSLAIPGSPVAEFHERTYGNLPYGAFVPMFDEATSGWRPESWASLFAQAGARYVVLVTKHHDGVTLWPSRTPNPHRTGWSTSRDLVGDLASAVRHEGLRFGTYYSGGLDWTFAGPGAHGDAFRPVDSFESMIDLIPQTEEYARYADAHWRELIDRYRPDLVWHDIGYPRLADAARLHRDYYARNPEGVVNDRFDFAGVRKGTANADFVTPEYASRRAIDLRMWESTRGIGHSFGWNHTETDADLIAPDALVHLFVDIVSKGGNLLLNVGPTSRGEIPAGQARRLLALGWWLEVNSAAIHGTRPWVRADGTADADLPLRFTRRGADLFAITLGAPHSRTLRLRDLAVPSTVEMRLLGHATPLAHEQAGDDTVVTLPARPADGPGIALQLCGAADLLAEQEPGAATVLGSVD